MSKDEVIITVNEDAPLAKYDADDAQQKMKTDRIREEECEICGKAGSRFVMLAQKGSNNADFYWICEPCEKAIRFVLARIDESEKKSVKTIGRNRNDIKRG